MALGLGLSAASQFNSRMMDRIYIYFKNKNNGVGEPEFRLPSMVPGSILLPMGLFISGWSAQNGVHWIAVDIGMAMVGAGMILSWQAMQTYLVIRLRCTLHQLCPYAALAATSTFRSIAGFGFPLFAPAMYRVLGYGKGDSVLACLAIALGCPAPFLFWKYGKRIRAKSGFTRKPVAQQSEEKESESNIKTKNSEKPIDEKA